ncbi:DUF3877 family protein [Anaeromicropila herbilytica]|uniref:Uncharacterized protein n=1 Tax=Anaeromicropila herbilytica TaxID=2785025 RepID=A0A7R7EJJ4_9FIRM|nr:DUF3877 family protein [Anaeromicropila herbilytica]BCN30295.1 hypothetical protein bsdtb5_15900 [Anaeromicropila herbilytica]
MKNKIELFENFSSNLEATIYEGIVKLGYLKGEPTNIFYTKDLFEHLLELGDLNKDEFVNTLKELIDYMESKYGRIKIGVEKERYKVTVPSCGVDYIQKNNQGNMFLKDLIEEMKKSDSNLEGIHSIFLKYSNMINDEVILEEANNDEFDYIMYFKYKKVDPFIYCFTINEISRYYHRLTEYDYNQLINHDN